MENKKPLFDFNDHKKKLIVIGAGTCVLLWDFIIIPVAATKGLILPPITLEHLKNLGMLLITL